MSSDAPGGDVSGSGRTPEGEGNPPATAGEWPTELVPPPVPQVQAAPEAPAAPAAAVSGPAPAPPAADGWGSAPAPPSSPVQAPQWDIPAAPPPAVGGWGAPPTTGQSFVPPGGQWGAPPPQAGGWGPAPGTPGAPPPGAWNPQPAQSGNGCLKACLIVGAVIVVLGIIAVIGITVLSLRFAQDLGVNPDGSVTACELLTNEELSTALGGEAEALPMGGLVDSTVGMVLDRRALPDAPDCWIVSSSGASVTGRLARQDGGDASGDYERARQAAVAGGYFADDASGVGDEAFCTGMSETGSFGILVRAGGNLAYVSLLDPAAVEDGSTLQPGLNGLMVSPETCAQAGAVALVMLR